MIFLAVRYEINFTSSIYWLKLLVCVWGLSTSVVSDSLQPQSLPGSSVHGISKARTLEWVAVSFSRGSSQHRDLTCVSCINMQILYHLATRIAQEACSIMKKFKLCIHFIKILYICCLGFNLPTSLWTGLSPSNLHLACLSCWCGTYDWSQVDSTSWIVIQY